MKAETDPITEDEWLLRLVLDDRFTPARVPIISPNAFEPRQGRNPDTDGISLFRRACLKDPADALLVIGEEKRARYGIVQIPVALLSTLPLPLSVKPARIEPVPGHVVLPELNITDYLADRARFTPVKLRLAEVASENIIRRPAGQPTS